MAKVTQLISGEGRVKMHAVQLSSPCSLILSSLSWIKLITSERFVPAQSMATLHYAAPLTLFPGQEPSVNWWPWDFIQEFEKLRPGPEPFSDCIRFRLAEPIQGAERVVPERGFPQGETAKQNRTVMGLRAQLCPRGKYSKCFVR